MLPEQRRQLHQKPRPALSLKFYQLDRSLLRASGEPAARLYVELFTATSGAATSFDDGLEAPVR
jgi:hypothetical protein